MKKKIFILLLAVAASVGTMFAWDYEHVQIGDLYYNLKEDKTAAVTYELSRSENNYSGLTAATIPASVTYNSVTYSVTSIGDWAFGYCTGLTSVTIPNSVTSIGVSAFDGCTGLTSVHISDIAAWCAISFGDNPLYYAHNLYLNGELVTNLVIPNSVTSIEEKAFSDCTGLTSVTIPNSVTSIGEGAFYGCSGLTSVTIPNSVTSIGNMAFYGCSGLTSVTIPNSVTSIGYMAFAGCTGLTSVTIPNSVTSIGSYAFGDCSGLTSVTIPNSVTRIGGSAFYDCISLTSVTLGTSVKVIEERAFDGCTAIETITCYSMRPPTVNNGAFEDLDYSTIVYVPADYLNTYKMHDFWGIYDVRPIGASKTETTEVKVEPAENTAEVAWPAVSGAATYELVIKDKSGNVICTLVFNANGQLTQIAFNAPSRNNAPQQTQAAGFSFTVTGLEEGTSYDLTITSKDNNGGTLDTKTVSFTTTGESQGIEDVLSDQVQCTKVIRDGKMYIIRGDKTYTLTGQEVK